MKQVTEELARVRELLKLFDERGHEDGGIPTVGITLGLLRAAQRHLQVAIDIISRVK